MTCAILDDEPLAHRVLAKYIDNIEYLELKKNLYSAREAISYFSKTSVDLLFLDINMPTLSGLDFIKSLQTRPMIIITSAHKDYAMDGYELDVVDYLLKPIHFDRFLKATNKVYEKADASKTMEARVSESDDSYTFIKQDSKTFKVFFRDIKYLEAFGSYVKIHTQERTLITLERLSNFENKLPGQFIRIHKSYIINLRFLTVVQGNEVLIEDKELPIGVTYRKVVKDLIS